MCGNDFVTFNVVKNVRKPFGSTVNRRIDTYIFARMKYGYKVEFLTFFQNLYLFFAVDVKLLIFGV